MKEPSIRLVLSGLEKEILKLRDRLGSLDIEGWDSMSAAQQKEIVHQTFPEFERVLRGIKFLHWRVGRLGRHKGERVKLTSAMVRTIKRNGHRNISALAKKLGVSRPTIYSVLKDVPREPKPTKPKFEKGDLAHDEALTKPDPRSR